MGRDGFLLFCALDRRVERERVKAKYVLLQSKGICVGARPMNTNLRVNYRNSFYSVSVALAFLSVYPCVGLALGTDEQRAACTPDVFRLCSSEIPNVDRIVVCLNVKKANLSPACRSALTPANSAKGARGRAEPVEY
jgi:hypothetical protein